MTLGRARLTRVTEGLAELVDDLLDQKLQVLLVVLHHLIVVGLEVESLEASWIGHDLTKLMELLVLVVVTILVLTGVIGNLDSKLVALVMDPGLIQDVEVIRHPGSKVLVWHANLHECDARHVDFLTNELLFDDLTSSRHFLAEALDLRNELLGLAWAKPTDELQHGVHVLMLTHEVDVHSDLVHDLDVDFFEPLSETRLVNPLLHWVKVQSQGLILSSDRTPQIEHFAERVLFEASQ